MTNRTRRRVFGTVLASTCVAMTFATSCKKLTDAKTDSFRATKRDFGWFGTERTAMLLHQFMLDESAAGKPSPQTDPMLKALNGVNACWYPLEIESEKIKTFAQNRQISKLYDLAPTPVTEYAVPLAQMMLAIEKIPELRTINDSWKKQTARILVDLPVDFALDYAMCSVGLSALVWGVAGIGAFFSAGTSLAAAPALNGWAIAACGVAAGYSGLYDGVKAPVDSITNSLYKDKLAGAVGQVFDDKEGRRKSIEARLPIYRDQQGQLGAFVEESVEEMPQIGWDEMERLQKLMRQLGSTAVASYPDGSAKNFAPDQRCDEIPVLKQKGNFYSPDMEKLPQARAEQLKAQGYSDQSISTLGSGSTLSGLKNSAATPSRTQNGTSSGNPSPQPSSNPFIPSGSGLSNY